RFGEPVDMIEAAADPNVELVESYSPDNMALPRLAFEMVYQINEVTPVTTTSLVCTTLLSRYSAEKRVIERDVASLMALIEANNSDGLVDREKPLGESIQTALNLLLESKVVQKVGSGVQAKYAVVADNYLMAVYYSNMAIHQLVDRAFAELAILGVSSEKPSVRKLRFWEEIMKMRDLFKFEFFYSHKPRFTDEVEASLNMMDLMWQKTLKSRTLSKLKILSEQQILVAQAVLTPYIEAYQVVAYALLEWNKPFDDKAFLKECLLLGEKMNWQGKIRRLESVSKPFLQNGIRLAKNRKLIADDPEESKKGRKERLVRVEAFRAELDDLSSRVLKLQAITMERKHQEKESSGVLIEREIVPGSNLSSITDEIMSDESGSHVGAFFDLDRTLIDRFSAVEFLQARFRSGRMTGREVLAQLSGIIVYAANNSDFGSLASIGGRGVKGLDEDEFIELGEEVYLKFLAKAIYPESRAMVAAHLSKGHTVAIVSAATPYQVEPVARDLGIDEIMCTRMVVQNGKFTGNLIEPACWGDGKAFYARKLAEKHNLDLAKSYFYTDSA
ncbi:MAG: HAD-IB family hydrolase, partial [Chloroflexota bacterium]